MLTAWYWTLTIRHGWLSSTRRCSAGRLKRRRRWHNRRCSGATIAFQLALNHKPPTWPDNAVPQQFHLDLQVDDLDAAAAYAESIGARRAASGDQSPNFIVFLDPSGHPFCLCA